MSRINGCRRYNMDDVPFLNNMLIWSGRCVMNTLGQWRNSRVAECRVPPPPRDFSPWNFCWPTGEREAKEKVEMGKKNGKERSENGEERKENGKREGGNWKWKEENLQNEERTFKKKKKKNRKNDFAPSEKCSSYAPALGDGKLLTLS